MAHPPGRLPGGLPAPPQPRRDAGLLHPGARNLSGTGGFPGTGRGLPLPLADRPAIAAQGFLEEPTWSELLAKAGFSQVQLAREWVTTTYPLVPVFLKSLQAMGATNPEPRPFSPRLLKALIRAYQEGYGEGGAIPVSYEVIWAMARKGSGQSFQ